MYCIFPAILLKFMWEFFGFFSAVDVFFYERRMNLNSVADIWKLVLEKLRATLSATTISTWFDETQAAAMQNKTFFLYCPSDFKRNSIESLYMDQIKDALRDIFSSDFEVKFLSRAEFEALETGEVKKPTSLLDSGEFTFDTFVVGDSNKLAYAAARAVADAPAEHYNPLFIYGDSGLGKTHLIYAVAHAIREKNPGAKIAYVKGDDLTNELVAAIQAGPAKTAEMREKYRQADLLLVDDVQFIAGRKQTQEEFFHTFNTLYESKRQIMLTSDRPPREMSLLDDRLQTRFEWGLLVDVQPPDFETRLAIIKNKAAQWGTVIDDDIANYIATNVTSNVRQLEGTMNKILAYRDLVGKEMDEESANRAVRDMMKKSNDYAPTAAMIITEVARYFGLEEDIIKGPSRAREAVNARQAAMFLVRRMTNFSTPEIGREFGDRDHTTVLHSLEQIEKKIKQDDVFAQTIRELTININSKN